MARCGRCSAGEPCDFKHGLGGRTNHGCKCEVCMSAMRKANTESARRRRSTLEGRERSRENARRYHARNRDVINARVRERRLDDPESARTREREYRLAHLERARQVAREYRARNHEKCLEWDRQYYHRHGAENRRRQRRRYWDNWDSVRARENARPRKSNPRRYPEAESKRRDRLAAMPAPRAFEVWTPHEDSLVMEDGLALVELCYMLGRSYNAIANRRNYLRKEQVA